MAKEPGLHLIVGLGNPGESYARTRHNAGFWLLDRLAELVSASFRSEARFKAQACRVDIAGRPICLLKPDAFMNDSGSSIASYASYYKISPARTLVAHDELALACGCVWFKRGGGHGGHNGLRDIMSHFPADFVRARIGIGHPGAGRDVARYVLNCPPAADKQLIDEVLSLVLDQIDTIVAGDIKAAFTAFDRPSK